MVSYDPVMVTREETPDSLVGLFKQRTRWNQGFIQVYRKGDWRQLPGFRQRLLARYTLATPFMQTFTGLAIPIGVAIGLFAEVPIVVALFSFVPLLPTLAILAFEIAGLHDFGMQYRLRVRPLHYLKLVIGGPFYQIVLAGAAMRAVWRELRGRNDWELTVPRRCAHRCRRRPRLRPRHRCGAWCRSRPRASPVAADRSARLPEPDPTCQESC